MLNARLQARCCIRPHIGGRALDHLHRDEEARLDLSELCSFADKLARGHAAFCAVTAGIRSYEHLLVPSGLIDPFRPPAGLEKRATIESALPPRRCGHTLSRLTRSEIPETDIAALTMNY